MYNVDIIIYWHLWISTMFELWLSLSSSNGWMKSRDGLVLYGRICLYAWVKCVNVNVSYSHSQTFMYEKSFNVTGLFCDHVTIQLVFARLGRVKQGFIKTCEEKYVSSFISSHVLKQNMFRNVFRKNGLVPRLSVTKQEFIYPQRRKYYIVLRWRPQILLISLGGRV